MAGTEHFMAPRIVTEIQDGRTFLVVVTENNKVAQIWLELNISGMIYCHMTNLGMALRIFLMVTECQGL